MPAIVSSLKTLSFWNRRSILLPILHLYACCRRKAILSLRVTFFSPIIGCCGTWSLSTWFSCSCILPVLMSNPKSTLTKNNTTSTETEMGLMHRICLQLLPQLSTKRAYKKPSRHKNYNIEKCTPLFLTDLDSTLVSNHLSMPCNGVPLLLVQRSREEVRWKLRVKLSCPLLPTMAIKWLLSFLHPG